jgi:hypothetical protein
VDNTNWSEDNIRVLWEILPGDSEHVFREISLEDIDTSLYSLDLQISPNDYPLLRYPALDPEFDCFDRVWTQSAIKIKTDIIKWNSENDQEEIRLFDVTQNNKGILCPFNSNRCQEGWCERCTVYLNFPS